MDKLTEEKKQRLAEAGRAAMNLSHGIKNIAQSMRSGQEVMDKALEAGDLDIAKRTWGILRQNLSRIEKLSLDMLTFDRGQSLNIRPCDFNQWAASVVEMVRPQADRRQVEIVTRFGRAIEPVPMDTERMTDAVLNLLLNAIEAVEPETGRITVGTDYDRDSQLAILRVSDNGRGVEDAEKIFEPFYSAKPGTNAGLGLSIARRIIQKHRGTIEVQSHPGQETVFTVRIPF